MAYKSRWTVEQKIAIVESLNTNISMAELCRKHNVTPNAFYGGKDKFLDAGKLALAGSFKQVLERSLLQRMIISRSS